MEKRRGNSFVIEDACSMREVHSGREVYKVLIDLRLMAGVCSLEVYEVEIEGMCWSVLDGSMPEKSFYQHCSFLHLHPFL